MNSPLPLPPFPLQGTVDTGSSSFNDGWEYRTPLGPFSSPNAAGAELTPVRLPHDALRDATRSANAPSGGASAYFPDGAYTYLKSFPVPDDWAGKVVQLEFQGVYRHAQVFVNDALAGNRADGYARFFVDITPFLRHGEENTTRVETRSGGDSRWYSGTGIHRPVLLHVHDAVHVVPDGVTVTTVRVEHDQAVVEVATTVVNRGLVTRTVPLVTGIHDPSGRELGEQSDVITLVPGRSGVVRQRFYLPEPALWSVETPTLHRVRTRLESAPAVDTAFGIRVVTVDPRRGLRINGEPVLLRGACVHSDNGVLGAASIARAEERRIELLKAAGFNAIRSAHNPASPSLLDACDRLGMLVMDEAFDMWTRGKTPRDYSHDFPQWWKADLESMVQKDVNHPSVILYSIGNEIVEVGDPHGAVLARDMAEHLRALDPTRLITNGVNLSLAVMDEQPAEFGAGMGLNEAMAALTDGTGSIVSGESVTRRTQESSSVLDVVGINYGEARYAQDAELFPERVIVGAETFPTMIGKLWPLVLQSDNVIGDFTWTGWDYLGEVGIGATAYAEDPTAVVALEREFPYLTAWCGDLDITGWRRPQSYYREIVFGLRTDPAIAVLRPEHYQDTVSFQSPWAWSDSLTSWTWPGFEGKPIEVEIYADADDVLLLLNDVEIARAEIGSKRPMTASIVTTYRPGRLVAVARTGGEEVGRTELHSASGPAALHVVPDRDVIRADDSDLAYVALEFRDAAGVLDTSVSACIEVDVTGPGVLAGLGTGNPKTVEAFSARTCTSFDGRALAVIRPTGTGTITITARTPGAEPTVTTIEASEPIDEGTL
ncbi:MULTISPECIES: glycoside hydrolase family 2 TIM barrel-domain containing protein [unclassified Rathayibacter]|uniref:glycoside hydrolase family 2 TIM barrel-domain containing protein n=1 Tax=unclassified Rathayibacter TaxID=2609250 RepID=UPI000CE81A3F|nr:MULTISPECIES: glycoside hydrolase family 2 TIM barrel-domain containing protein [unclassified Rathayibacter]PPG09879.1 glycoside hydrolase family 2 [Rathayibacter sp. AY2B1]PPG69063.1 glycoside hydrolase family 2 [Rathayibacter sp. AY1F4]